MIFKSSLKLADLLILPVICVVNSAFLLIFFVMCFCILQVRRLKEFGVTKGELARYMDALIKDSEHLAAMIDNVPSVDNLDFIMESDALGHTVMDQRQGHECLLAIAGTVTLEEVFTEFFTWLTCFSIISLEFSTVYHFPPLFRLYA